MTSIYVELTGIGKEPHTNTDGLTLQSAAGDRLKFHKLNDDTPSPSLITCDIYIENQIVALINLTYDDYLDKPFEYYNKNLDKKFTFILTKGKITLS